MTKPNTRKRCLRTTTTHLSSTPPTSSIQRMGADTITGNLGIHILLSELPSFAEPSDGPFKHLNEVALCLLSPVGSSGVRYSDKKTWDTFKTGERVPYASADDKITLEAIEWAIYDLCKAFNTRTHLSLQSIDPLARGVARTAFAKRAASATPMWTHSLLQFLLLDKLLWLTGKDDSKNCGRQLPAYETPEHTSKNNKIVMDLYYKWDVIVGNFMRDWRKEMAGRGSPNALRGTSSEILSTLYTAVVNSLKTINVNRVENNVCSAAIGVVALTLVSVHNISKRSALKRTGFTFKACESHKQG